MKLMCKINNTRSVLPILAYTFLEFSILFVFCFLFCFLKNIDSAGSIVDMMWSLKALGKKKKAPKF